MNEHTSRELDAAMARLADGDRRACAVVFSLLWAELVRFAERLLGKGPDADDAAQQALEKIFTQAADYDSSRPAFPWALAITGWECRTTLQRRKRLREAPVDQAFRLPSTSADPERAAVESSMLEALRESLEGLPATDQKALEEAFFQDAEEPRESAFRKRKQRALTHLRAAWRKIYD